MHWLSKKPRTIGHNGIEQPADQSIRDISSKQPNDHDSEPPQIMLERGTEAIDATREIDEEDRPAKRAKAEHLVV